MRFLGCIPDLEDVKDFFFAAHPVVTDLPKPSASVEDSRVKPKNQTNTNACVGCSVAQGVRLVRLHQGFMCPELSHMAAYRIARNIDGEKNDVGTYLRSGIKALQKAGIPAEAYWPHDESKINAQVPFGAMHDGFDASGMRHYYRVTNADDVRRAISSGFVVVGGWQIAQTFEDWDGKGLAQNIGRILGGHAMPIVSYDSDGTFRLLNSWGTAWGQSGYAHVDEAFIEEGTDLWAIDITP